MGAPRLRGAFFLVERTVVLEAGSGLERKSRSLGRKLRGLGMTILTGIRWGEQGALRMNGRWRLTLRSFAYPRRIGPG